MYSNVIKLVPRVAPAAAADPALLAAAEIFLREVRSGRITGFAIVCTMVDKWFVDAIGECNDDLTRTRDMVGDLDDELRERAERRRVAAST
jgi:hypothetical protein